MSLSKIPMMRTRFTLLRDGESVGKKFKTGKEVEIYTQRALGKE